MYGPHDADGPATFELRVILLGAENIEDPVTGSANAALATLLDATGRRPGASYTVRQGTALDRDGRVSIEYDDEAHRCTDLDRRPVGNCDRRDILHLKQ